MAAAVAIASLDVLIEEKLPQRSRELGNYFMHSIRERNYLCVGEIRGKGLMIGVEIKKEYGPARKYCERLMDKGILCKETHGQTIRFSPPLVITREEIDWAMKQIEEVLA